MKVDLKQLRLAIDAAPAAGMTALPVDKNWLEHLYRELSAARAADRAVALVDAAGGVIA